MAVDKNGFITEPVFSGFQHAFAPVVSDVVQKLSSDVPDKIHSIYVYGSLAEGKGREALSDLDLTVIFTRELNDLTAAKMQVVKAELEQQYSVISKIDIDPGVLDEVILPASANRWGYWLKHHCVCVYGEDLRERFKPFRPSRDIAVAVNGDFLTVLNGYISLMKPSLEPLQRHSLQRAAARKAIRSTSILRDENDPDWPASLEEHCAKFNDRYPALSEEMDYLLSISKRPRGDIMTFASRLSTFAYWLNAEFSTRMR
ncbi:MULTISPECIES: nucleotidyltransferase domain-containing protein [unclassified Pantoea]|uniref:nucleotidyltransferase domain-containing protein n=1 Tax=unclassified Pantoea TaxID=2630326 RepID=UPI001CD26337|nr:MULTISPECIES: nucleotidyltransferase domain-containing protein [unclassified Pantoea]MCA1179333.1 nucleotidyltransferase domain-containing protein [Pantoea sp. alder69]MCA1252536.1 nucleotidyltransferase domain-containing protein [Pantoea sp. alder70]MCA1268119.1 nucleotidyltransferase domain-containing protein [Pantoea sp. alder81]